MPSEEGIFFDIAPDGDGRNRIYVNFYDAGTFSVEVSMPELERLHRQLGKFLGDHVIQHDLPPIGTCEHGEVRGSEIICHSDDICEHQQFERDHTHLDPIFCGREASALEKVEREQR